MTSRTGLAARILLVDDETRILELFSEMLSDLGHPVIDNPGPGRPWTSLPPEKFDIVFLDQFLGPIKGTDLMQEWPPAIPTCIS